MEIVFVDYGIANNFGNRIEVNRNLIWYPNLLYRILKHERSHNKGAYSKEDLKLDMFSKKKPHEQVSSWELLKFCIAQPSGFRQLLPIYPASDGWYLDKTRAIIT